MSLLREIIGQEIRERGPIPFSRYMELCLYHPTLGYYSRNAEQFGKAGDFYTASDIHAVFGRLLARQFEEIWRMLDSPSEITLKELGPGRGLFAQDMLHWSEKKFPGFFRTLRYVAVEQSPALRERIEQTLTQHIASGKGRLSDPVAAKELNNANNISANDTNGKGVIGKSTTLVVPNSADKDRALAPEGPVIVFANEFFDAIPVEVVTSKGTLRISSSQDRFVETWVPSSPEELEFLDSHSIHPEPGERVEVPLGSQAYLQDAARFERGFVIVIDYGFTREEQLAGRHRGTLKAIRRHSVSANPYEAPGEQDITADVNFTALASFLGKSGFQVQKLVTQSQFLLGIGEANQFADAFEDCRLPQERAKVALQLKHLVTPAGMGESFHVLVASKGIEVAQVAGLVGLTFGGARDLRERSRLPSQRA